MYNNRCNEKYFTEVSTLPKDLNVVLLLDYYGGLLPDKQRRLTEYYYYDDLSLTEISETEGITRQGARDAIVRAVGKLKSFESTVGFAGKSDTLKKAFEAFEQDGTDDNLQVLKQAVEDM